MFARWFSKLTLLVFLLAIFLGMKGDSAVRYSGGRQVTLQDPQLQEKTHDAGNIWLTITNCGAIGGYPISCRYPAGSAREYLFYGDFWIGSIVGDDTLVSAGAAGWTGPAFLPGSEPGDTIIEEQVVSDQDYIATCTDTVTAQNPPGAIPLGVELLQRSYAWVDTTHDDFVIFDCRLRNIGENSLKDVYVGIYIDADCGSVNEPGHRRAEDDVTGLMWMAYGGDSVPLPWARDYDWDDGKTPGVIGLEFLGLPDSADRVTYNWWAPYDTLPWPQLWGPTDPDNLNDVPYPWDRQDYYVLMSNGYFDPDQMDSVNAPYNTPADQRFLFSFGPFDLNPGDTTNFAFALVCGLGFSEFGFHVRQAKDLYERGYALPDTGAPPSPARIELFQNRPNPFTGTTTIYFTLSGIPGRIQDAKHITLFVYDVNGRFVRTLADWPKSPGLHWCYWDGQDDVGRMVPSGIYFYRLQLGELSTTRRMVLVR